METQDIINAMLGTLLFIMFGIPTIILVVNGIIQAKIEKELYNDKDVR